MGANRLAAQATNHCLTRCGIALGAAIGIALVADTLSIAHGHAH